MNRPDKITIPTNVAEDIIDYLGKRPYNEVYNLIDNLKSGEHLIQSKNDRVLIDLNGNYHLESEVERAIL